MIDIDDDRPLWVGADGIIHIGEPGEEYLAKYGEPSANILEKLAEYKRTHNKSSSPEQIQDLEKEFGTQGDNSDTGTPYQSREDVPESARELWDIMHNDEAINSMRRGM